MILGARPAGSGHNGPMAIACPTRFTELVGCAWPVQLAAMGGGAGGPELAAAVGAAGGLGMVSWTEEVPDPACGVNFLVPFLPGPKDIAAIAQKASVAEFFFGSPDPEAVGSGQLGRGSLSVGRWARPRRRG